MDTPKRYHLIWMLLTLIGIGAAVGAIGGYFRLPIAVTIGIVFSLTFTAFVVFKNSQS